MMVLQFKYKSATGHEIVEVEIFNCKPSIYEI